LIVLSILVLSKAFEFSPIPNVLSFKISLINDYTETSEFLFILYHLFILSICYYYLNSSWFKLDLNKYILKKNYLK